jgi:PPM family protein phosphatase
MEHAMKDSRPAPLPSPPHVVQSFHPFSSKVQIDVSGVTHPGHLRENNEDQFYIARLSRALETVQTSLPADAVPDRAEEVNYAMVVADGMGGHAAGEVASRLAISGLVALALEIPNWILRLDSQSGPELERRARESVQQIGAMMFKEGRDHEELHGMGSTLTIARSLGRELLVVHVGDSRAYLLRSSQLHRLTKDHTYAQMLVDCGKLAACDVAESRVRHILTNALGGSSSTVDVDVDLLRLENGDRVLLCSDGLTDLVDDDTITTALAEAPSAKDACDRLLQLALDRGGRDNITVIVAGYTLPAED